MSYQEQTPFTSFVLSEEEILSAYDLSLLTLQALQTLRSTYALNRLNLKVTTNDVPEFIQSEAYLKGQMDVVTYILDLAEAAQQAKLANSQQ